MTQISPHFSLSELTHTDTGLPNVPGADEVAALGRLAEICLEPMREMVGPLRVNRGYSSPAVNARVGGVATSQHLRGEAADLFPLDVSPAVLFDLTRASAVNFDQLILEPNWVHVSTSPLGRAARRQALKARVVGGKVVGYDPVR